MNVLKPDVLGPIPAIQRDDLRSDKILLDDGIHLRLGGCSRVHDQNLGRIEHCQLVDGPDITLTITELTEYRFPRGDVDKD